MDLQFESASIKSDIDIKLNLLTTSSYVGLKSSFLNINFIAMKNHVSTKIYNQNDYYGCNSQAELQRRFVDLQFKRSELEKKLKRVNEVLFLLGREMEQHYSNNKHYK